MPRSLLMMFPSQILLQSLQSLGFKVKVDDLLKINPQPAAKVPSTESMETLEACGNNGFGICGVRIVSMHGSYMHACIEDFQTPIFRHQ